MLTKCKRALVSLLAALALNAAATPPLGMARADVRVTETISIDEVSLGLAGIEAYARARGAERWAKVIAALGKLHGAVDQLFDVMEWAQSVHAHFAAVRDGRPPPPIKPLTPGIADLEDPDGIVKIDGVATRLERLENEVRRLDPGELVGKAEPPPYSVSDLTSSSPTRRLEMLDALIQYVAVLVGEQQLLARLDARLTELEQQLAAAIEAARVLEEAFAKAPRIPPFSTHFDLAWWDTVNLGRRFAALHGDVRAQRRAIARLRKPQEVANLLGNLTDLINGQQSYFGAAARELEEARAPLAADARGLESDSQQLNSRGTALEQEQKALESERTALEGRAKALETSRGQLAAAGAALEARIDAYTKAGEQLERERHQLEARQGPVESRSSQLQQRANELTAQQDALGRRQQALEAKQAELLRQGREFEREEAQIEQESNALQALRNKIESTSCSNRACADTVNGWIADYNRRTVSLDQWITSYTARATPVHQAGVAIQREIAAFNNDAQRFEQAARDLGAAWNQLQREGDNLSRDVDGWNQRAAAHERTAAELKTAQDTHLQFVGAWNAGATKLEADRQAWSRTASAWEERRVAYESSSAQLRQRIGAWNTRRAELERRDAALAAAWERYQANRALLARLLAGT